MDNVYAWRLGEACTDAIKQPSGDYIDTGWALAKALHAKGFDIVPREKLSFLDPRKTINEMCNLIEHQVASPRSPQPPMSDEEIDAALEGFVPPERSDDY